MVYNESPKSSEQGEDKWNEMRTYIPAVAVSSVLQFFVSMRKEIPFNRLMPFPDHPSYLEWIGLLVVVYGIPAAIFFIFGQKKEFLDISGDFGTAVVVFVGFAFIIGLLGAIIGYTISFIIWIIFY